MRAIFSGISDAICEGLEALEPDARFVHDHWEREGGGGGLTRVLRDGEVFEKGGVNFSEVFGHFSEEFAKQVPGSGTKFYATGVSLVLHPNSAHVPTVHLNLRYIEHGDKQWFGGGADLTPYYFHEEDKAHFHGAWKAVCERHGQDHARFQEWCDEYFYLPHRNERRGVGGIFFDNLDVSDVTEAFVKDAGASFLDAYLPIVRRRMGEDVTREQN